MLDYKCYTKEWIDLKLRELRGGDPILLEKAIHAISLMALLVKENLSFVFKGGTSLMVRLPGIKRLSIDIDIISEIKSTELEAVVSAIGQQRPFREE